MNVSKDALEPEAGSGSTLPGGAVLRDSSSVHQHETTQRTNWVEELQNEGLAEEATSEDSPYQKFRHSGWQNLRKRVRESLARADTSAARLKRFEKCGTGCYLWRSSSLDALSIRGNFCRNRACIPCMNARSVLVQRNVSDFITNRTVRFLTCTLKQNGTEHLGQMLDRLRKSLTILYRQPEWKAHVKGWAVFIEIKRGARFRGWHVHAHMLCEGSWWEQKAFSAAWHACTGDSMVVDIRAVTDARGGAYYAAKYATKGCNLHDLDSEADLDEVILETLHRRLTSVHGSWKGKLKLNEQAPSATDWYPVDSLDQIVTMSQNGDVGAATLFRRLTNQTAPQPPPTPPPRQSP